MTNKQPWVLVTGASTGIGKALAFRFAQEGYHIVLVARDAQRLAAISESLQQKYHVSTHVIVQDLTQPDAASLIFHALETRGIVLRVVVNNAGLGACGPFHSIEAAKDDSIIDVNIRALTGLTKLAISHLRAHGGGSILNVASTGAYQPGPYISVYYASKAYVLSFTQAIRRELKGSGITVCALCPGATATEFSDRAGKADVKGAMTAKHVADCAYQGLMRGRGVIIPGVFNKIMILFSKLAPSGLSAAVVARIQKKLIDDFHR